MLVLLLALLTGSGSADPAVSPAVIQGRLLRLHMKGEDRVAELRRIFSEAGCPSSSYREEKIRNAKLPNVICTLPGSSSKKIVVSAHYDNRGPGEGAIDNWTGASVLPSVYQLLRSKNRRLTYEFIAFTDEDKGLAGSRDHVNHLSREERALTIANVNVDCLGLASQIHAWAGPSDPRLLASAAIVANQTGVAVRPESMDPRHVSDASAFLASQIPAIDFHSLSREALVTLHNQRDSGTALDLGSYYRQYRFLVAYLEYLEASLAR